MYGISTYVLPIKKPATIHVGEVKLDQLHLSAHGAHSEGFHNVGGKPGFNPFKKDKQPKTNRKSPSKKTYAIHVTGQYLWQHLGEFYGFHVGKYTSPMDGTGINGIQQQ